jgi:hypothetical protein
MNRINICRLFLRKEELYAESSLTLEAGTAAMAVQDKACDGRAAEGE